MTDKTYTQEEVEALITEKTEGLKNKNNELISEQRQVNKKLTDYEADRKQSEDDGLKQREEFKELYERSEATNKELRETIIAKDEKERKDALTLATVELSGSLTRDTTKAGLLAEQAAKYATYTDGKVIYEIGGVEVDAAGLKEHLTSGFGFLVDGSGNTGSGASGNQGGGAVTKKFNEHTPAELKSIKDNDPAKYEALRQTR